MPSAPIAITGATGGIGGRIARLLANRGVPMRLIVRDLARAPELPNTDIAAATYADKAAMADAVKGLETVFFVSGFEAADRLDQHKRAIDAFAEAGIGRIVYTSFINCAADSTFTFARDHFHTEEHMASRGLAFAALRNNFYADLVPRLVSGGAIRGPAGNGRFAPVTRDDVAAVAASMLVDPSAPTGRFDVTGPERITMEDAAAVLSDVTASNVSFVNETLEEAYASRAEIEAPQFEIEGWVTSYAGIAAGEFDAVSDTVERWTGRKPQSLREFLKKRP